MKILLIFSVILNVVVFGLLYLVCSVISTDEDMNAIDRDENEIYPYS